VTSTPRRTQQQRREATITKLLDATVDALGEVGYARTTVQEICTRADVSQGGLFRHFPTRLDLVIAAADEVRARQFEAFSKGLANVGSDSLAACLRLVREACRAPMNAAWYELLIASRHDAELRERLAPLAARYHAEIAEFARAQAAELPLPPESVDTVIFTIVHLFDGEALAAAVHPQPEQEDLRLRMLEHLLRGGSLYDPVQPAIPSTNG